MTADTFGALIIDFWFKMHIKVEVEVEVGELESKPQFLELLQFQLIWLSKCSWKGCEFMDGFPVGIAVEILHLQLPISIDLSVSFLNSNDVSKLVLLERLGVQSCFGSWSGRRGSDFMLLCSKFVSPWVVLSWNACPNRCCSMVVIN